MEAILPTGKEPKTYQGEIVVPFSPETLLSGVGRRLEPGETLWYRRTFALPEESRKDRVLLHFGAVDQCCRVFVNGKQAGEHKGGYLPFTCDITEQMTAEAQANRASPPAASGTRPRAASGRRCGWSPCRRTMSSI